MRHSRKFTEKKRIFSIFIILILLASTFSPAIGSRLGSDRISSKKIKTTSLDRFKEKIYNFLNNTLIKKFPRLGELPFMQHLLKLLSPNRAKYSNDSEQNESQSDENAEDFQNDNGENGQSSGQESSAGDNENVGGGESASGNMMYSYPDPASIEERASILSESNSLNVSDNATVIPKKGHIYFIGQGNIDVNLVLNINGTIITVVGHLYIGPNKGTVDVMWNTDEGYFEMTGNGTFSITDFYFNAGNKIIFMAGSLDISANGHVMIDGMGYTGELMLDGVIGVSNLSFDIDVQQTNLSIGASLSFSGNTEAHDFYASWGSDGIFLNGSFDGISRLDISGFHVITPQFGIAAQLITLYSSAEFDFEQSDGNNICRVSSNHLEIEGITIISGNQTTTLERVTVTGTLNIFLHIDSGSYVSAEEGRIVISGNTVMDINTTVNVNGTVVKIKGKFGVESAYDAINILWNKTLGYLFINCTSLLRASDFVLDINNSMLNLHWKKLVLNPGAHIWLDKTNGTRFIIGGGSVDVRGFMARANLKNSSISLWLDSLHLDLGGYLELFSGNNESKLSANTVFGHSLSIQGIDVSAAGFTFSADGVSLDGFWEVTREGKNISLNVMGILNVQNLSAASGESTIVDSIFLGMGGDARLTVGGGILEAYVEGGGYIKQGESQLGFFSMVITGSVHLIMDLETGEIYGEFGFGGSVVVGSIGVSFDGGGTFSLTNDVLQIQMEVDGEIQGYLSDVLGAAGLPSVFHIDNLVIFIDTGAHLVGTFSADVVVYIDLKTGNISIDATVKAYVSVLVSIDHIGIYGKDINIDGHDWEDLGIGEDSMIYSLHISAGSVDVNLEGNIEVAVVVAVGMIVSDAGMGMGFGLAIGAVHGSMDWTASVEEIEISYQDNFVLHIGSIDSEGTFTITAFPLITTEDAEYGIGAGLAFSINGSVTINDFEISATTENISINVSLDEISVDVEGGLKLLYYGNGNGAFAINGTGYLGIEGLEFDGSFYGVNVTASLGIFNVTVGGTLVAYGNGTLKAEGEASLNLEDVSIDIENIPIIGNVSIDIAYLTFYMEAYLSIQPHEDGSTTCTFLGYVEFNTTFNVSGENFDLWGNITAEGIIYVNVRKNPGDITNITYVEIAADTEIQHADICLGGTITISGVDVNFSFNLVNYSGDGFLRFTFDFLNNSFYMANFQEDAHWDAFNFSIADGLIYAEIKQFSGDLLINNFFFSQELLDNLSAEMNATSQIFAAMVNYLFGGDATVVGGLINFFEIADEVLQGWLDPDNWTIHSENGFETLFGFSFSSEYGMLFSGDVNFAGTFHIYQFYCAPGTEGRFEINVDQYGNLRFDFEATSGFASIVMGITYDDITIWMRLDTTSGEIYFGIGDFFRIIDDITDGEWDELQEDLQRILNNEGFFGGWANAFVQVGTGEYESLAQKLRDALQELLNENPNLPDALVELIKEIIQKLNEAIEKSCFLAGTKIEMADGSVKNIEDIKVGDLVKSYDVKEKKWKTGVVTKVFHHSPDEMGDYYLIVNKELRVTPNHPFYVNGRWISAGELKIGDTLDGNTITSIERVYKKVPTYNIEVEPYHTYRIVWGKAKAVVHNAQQEESNISDNSSAGDKHLSVCFLSGTKIEMADGSVKNIEDIKVGDLVKSYDTASKTWRVGTVTKVFHHSPDEMGDYYLVINKELRVTPNHPVWVNGKWIHAEELRIGDNFGGNVIYSIEKVYRKVPTYNIEVEPYHTYKVVWGNSHFGSVVHNAMEEENSVMVSDKQICFLHGTKVVVVKHKEELTNYTITNIEDVEVGDSVLVYNPITFELIESNVTKVYHHLPYQMVSGYVEIQIVILPQMYREGASLINKESGEYADTSGIPTHLTVKVTPNHPLLVSEEPPSFTAEAGSGMPANIPEYRFIPAGRVKPGLYTLGGKVVNVVYHPDAREDSYHIQTEKPLPYLIVPDNASYILKAFLKKKAEEEQGNGGYPIYAIRIPAFVFPVIGGAPKNVTNSSTNTTCFLSGTKIEMADGSVKDIEDIKVGDLVKSYDTASKTWRVGIVSKVFHHSPDEMGDYYLVINKELRVTPNHPVWVNGKWIHAGELKIGDRFGDNVIYSIDKVYKKVPTYNFEVEPYHTYAVVWGKGTSVVHNKLVNDDPQSPGGPQPPT